MKNTKQTNTNANNGNAIYLARENVESALYAQRAFLERAMSIVKDESATQEQKDQAMRDYENAKNATLAYKEELNKLLYWSAR